MKNDGRVDQSDETYWAMMEGEPLLGWKRQDIVTGGASC